MPESDIPDKAEAAPEGGVEQNPESQARQGAPAVVKNAANTGAAATAPAQFKSDARKNGLSPFEAAKSAFGRTPPAQQEVGALSRRLKRIIDGETAKAEASFSAAERNVRRAGKTAVSGRFSTVTDGILDIARVAETAKAKYAPGLLLSAIHAADEAEKKDSRLKSMAESIKRVIRAYAEGQVPAALDSLGSDALAAAFKGEDGQKELDEIFRAIGEWDQVLERHGHLLINSRDLKREIERIQSQVPRSLDAESILKQQALVNALMAAGLESVSFKRRGRNFAVDFSNRAVLPLRGEELAADLSIKVVPTDSVLEQFIERFHRNPTAWNGARLIFEYWHMDIPGVRKGHNLFESFWAALRYWLKAVRFSL